MWYAIWTRSHSEQLVADQLLAKGADSFANTNFPGSFLRPCGAEIHKINTGKDQYKNADDAKQPYVLNAPACVHSVFEFFIQMPFAHGLKEKFRGYSSGAPRLKTVVKNYPGRTAPYDRGSLCRCKRLVPILSRDHRERFSAFFSTAKVPAPLQKHP